MERVAILVNEENVDASHFAFLTSGGTAETIAPTGESGHLAEMMERHERALVLAALERYRWRMTKTAEALGLERSHLYKKLKALGIDKPVVD
jgi:DNA-binding NtrC family response regulator